MQDSDEVGIDLDALLTEYKATPTQRQNEFI